MEQGQFETSIDMMAENLDPPLHEILERMREISGFYGEFKVLNACLSHESEIQPTSVPGEKQDMEHTGRQRFSLVFETELIETTENQARNSETAFYPKDKNRELHT